MVGAVSVEAVSGGAVLVMNYFGAVSVEAVSEWGRFDQLPISRCRELKSIPDTEKLTISRYQKMISQGMIPDILISANTVPRVNICLSNSPISQRFPP